MKGFKKYRSLGISGLLLFTLLFASPAFAEEALAGEAEVFQVLFPTDTERVFDFIMDPQELIAQTDAAAYGGLTFEEGATLFFRRQEEGAKVDYSSVSDALVITNMGSSDVELTVTAGISRESLGALAMTDDCEFTDDTKASLYLALTDGEHVAPISGEEGAVIRTTLAGVDEGDGAGREYRFWLVGAVNRNGDWSETGGANPKVTVTWSAAPVEKEGPEADPEEEEEALPLESDGESRETSGSEEDSEKIETSGPEETSDEEGSPGTDAVPKETGVTGMDPGETEMPGTETSPKETGATGVDPEETEMPETEEPPKEAEISGTDEEPRKAELSGTEELPKGTEIIPAEIN